MPCFVRRTGHRRRGGPIRDPPGISVPLVELMTEILPEVAYRPRIAESSSLLLP